MTIRRRTIAGIDVIEIPGDPQGAGIVLFHGFGADHSDLVSLHQMFQAQEKRAPSWFFPNGPLEILIGYGTTGRAWFEIDFQAIQNNLKDVLRAFPSDLSLIRTKAEQFIKELDIPLSKLFLGGFSQGAVLAIETALHLSDKIAGLAIFSGTLINEQQWKILAKQKGGMPFFQSHGLNDSILPIQKARELEKLFIEAKMQGKLHTFQGGHEIPHSILLEFNRFLYEHL